jgi:hypothetical protein
MRSARWQISFKELLQEHRFSPAPVPEVNQTVRPFRLSSVRGGIVFEVYHTSPDPHPGVIQMSIISIAKSVGAVLSNRYALDTLSYDGQTIATHLRKDRRFEDGEILHEICHFAVATEEERKLPEFGMVARPSIRFCRGIGSEWDKYEARTPSPALKQPDRNIRECASQYLHYGVAQVLGMCPAVPNVPWKTWLHFQPQWVSKGVPWIRSQGYDPDELLSRMIDAAQSERLAA